MKRPIEEYICIYKEVKVKESHCETCNGLTNMCGLYENKFLLPFTAIKRRLSYEDEELGMFY